MQAVSDICIALLTYNRLEYAERTLTSALNYIRTDKHKISVHIASDGDSVEYIQSLVQLAMTTFPVHLISWSNSERGGYGKNFNLMTQAVHEHADYVLPLEDDWELNRELHLDPLVDVLAESKVVESIRLGYLGYTQKLCGYVEKIQDMAYLVLDPASDEHHVFSGHPRLETVAYQRRVGLWPEGLLPGQTEFFVATEMRESRVGVAWPMDLLTTNGNMFGHIGTIRSY